jgi:hypothetical protein
VDPQRWALHRGWPSLWPAPRSQIGHGVDPVDLVKFDLRGEAAIPNLFPHSGSFGLHLTRDFDLCGGAITVIHGGREEKEHGGV